MGSKWKKIKMLLGKRVCIMSPEDRADLRHSSGGCGHDDTAAACSSTQPIANNTSGRRRFFTRSNTEPIIINTSDTICTHSAPTTPTLSYAGLVSASSEGRTSGIRLSRSTCAICLESMKPGHGQALFTAECSHTFHFSCIVSNVRYGNQVCPICRAKWKDVPWQAGVDTSKSQRGRSGSHRRAPSVVPRVLADIGRLDLSNGSEEEWRRHNLSLQFVDEGISQRLIYPGEPDLYDDDEPLMQSVASDASTLQANRVNAGLCDQNVGIKAYAEVSAIPACESRQCFTVLIHLKAPPAGTGSNVSSGMEDAMPSSHLPRSSSRAPLDLVAVLDISGSMAGRKLVLLKQAMGFVVRNLSSADRLSVVVFSSTAKRIFPLRKMGEEGQRQSLQAMDALIATGGTNIAEGLRKGLKVLEDRKERNPVSSIMLLSDGQDTYSMNSRRQLPFFITRGMADSRRLVPRSLRRSTSVSGHMQIPVHTFGFGSDHDAATMHTISEVSGGTFSFIQAEEVVQDAFAQCIGGLLSVVIQDVQLTVSCSAPGVLINGIHAGSYDSSILDSARHGIVKLGDLYAEEERDVLVDLKLPVLTQSQGTASMSLVLAGCIYKDPLTQEVNQNIADELCIVRPLTLEEGQQVISLEVDRQRNRLRTTEAIAEARSLADQGNIEAAQYGLRSARAQLENSQSALAGDQLCNVLKSELSEIQERMANRQLYERSGRAYLLSAQSSHLRQRATTRGDSLDGLTNDYQTPSMVDMITLSQTRSPPERNMSAAFPFVTNQGSSATVPNHSSSRSLLRRASAKVRRSHGNV